MRKRRTARSAECLSKRSDDSSFVSVWARDISGAVHIDTSHDQSISAQFTKT